jgi:hypothetical protein
MHAADDQLVDWTNYTVCLDVIEQTDIDSCSYLMLAGPEEIIHYTRV